MKEQNVSLSLNTSLLSEWSSTLPLWLQGTTLPSLRVPEWFQNTTLPSLSVPEWFQNTTVPSLRLPPHSEMAPYAVYYFLSGAMFFLGSVYMFLSTPPPDYRALDGIATMSDFTKTHIMKPKSEKRNRELTRLLKSNGMESEEFLGIVLGNTKRPRYSSSTT